MENNLFDKYNALDSYFKNENQEIWVCKNIETDKLYLVNSIINMDTLQNIDFEGLATAIGDIEEIVRNESVHIITQYNKYSNIKDYISTNKVKISEQVAYLTSISNLILKLKEYPEFIIVSLINVNNLQINNVGKISSSGVIIVDNDFLNMNKTYVFQQMANVIHVIFSGTEIVDGKISSGIPPGIKKLINKCLNDEYFAYEDFVSDFKATKIYRLINPEVQESKKIHKARKKLTRRRRVGKIKRSGVIVMAILLITSPFIIPTLAELFGDKKEVMMIEKEQELKKENIVLAESNDKAKNIVSQDEEEMKNYIDNITYFFNDEVINKVNAENIGNVDTDKYFNGDSSINVVNIKNEKTEFFIGSIDLTKDMFSYLKGRNVDVSMRLVSSIDTEGTILVKGKKEGNILTTVSKKMDISSDIWTLNNLNIDTGKCEIFEMYLEIDPKVAIWVDSFSVDILK